MAPIPLLPSQLPTLQRTAWLQLFVTFLLSLLGREPTGWGFSLFPPWLFTLIFPWKLALGGEVIRTFGILSSTKYL